MTIRKKYKHAWVFLYCFIYIPWFTYLERTVTTTFYPVHMKLDDYIPFVEAFVIPYYLWFPFTFFGILYLFFRDTKEFYRCTAFLGIGMTICLVIYTIWPNGQLLRPDLSVIGRDNLLISIVKNLYAMDTPTNVCPSIHVYNSLSMCIAVFYCKSLKDKKYITIPTIVLSILICLATVFLKQHSVFDMICAFLLAFIIYAIVYLPNYSKLFLHRKYVNDEAV